MKRAFDLIFSACGLLITSPVLLAVAAAIYAYDFHNPLYIATRIGRRGHPFPMVKFRSMVVNADRTGVTSTSSADSRVTPIGRFVRKFKLDELIQLWNVLVGDMSMVGPRPNVPSGVAVYTPAERELLTVRPGITDFASIVFADEGEILKGRPDADLAYDQLIRPWKSRLGLFYAATHSLLLDLQLVVLTVVAVFARPVALEGCHRLLNRLGAPTDLANIALRRQDLVPMVPPGAGEPRMVS
jgi:lipopolysaccharide/colanic/teichoic acid biosynthesis glycosyltransferase